MPANVLGVQLMKLFLSDLLGRDTAEAKIFQQAVEKELPTARVVSLWAKVLAIVVMIGLNFCFVFAAILYGKDKSYKWQGVWLSTFFFNFAFDVAVNNTLEVLVMEYFIPWTIKSRAAVIKTKLEGIITTIANSDSVNSVNSVNSVAFNVPDYFFVSTMIARRRPELLESKLILAYKSTTPHDISIAINKVLAVSISNDKGVLSIRVALRFLRMVLSSVALILPFLLIQLGLLPDIVQVLVLRVLQPLVMAGSVYFFSFLVQIKVIFICVVAIIPIYGNIIIIIIVIEFT